MASAPGSWQSVRGARNRFIVVGCPAMAAQRTVVALHSLPRVTKELQASTGRAAIHNLVAGSSFYIIADERCTVRLPGGGGLPAAAGPPQG